MNQRSFRFLALFVSFLTFSALTQIQADPVKTLDEADAAFGKGSYARAFELYTQATQSGLSESRKDWARFRLADSQWREKASGDRNGDNTVSLLAQQQLQRMADDLATSPKAPAWLHEIWISLGDYERSSNPNSHGWNQVQPYYLKALQHLEKQNQSEDLRKRYLQVVMKALERNRQNEPYFQPRQFWPLPVSENAMELARSRDEQSGASLLLALGLQQTGAWQYPAGHERIRKAYVQALSAGKSARWYDDTLWSASGFAENYGRLIESIPGQYRAVPDYPETLNLLQRLLSEFKKGETGYYDNASERVNNIQKPSIRLYAASAFLPSSLIELNLNTRNMEAVQFRIRKLNLAKHFEARNLKRDDFYKMRNEKTSTSGAGEVVREWKVETRSDFVHMPFSKTEKTQPLPAGAYWVEAQSGTTKSGTLLLVTQTALTLQDAGGKILAFVCDAMTGAPKAGQVQLLVYNEKNEMFSSRSLEATTDADGVAWIEWNRTQAGENHYGQVAIALADGEPALVQNLNINRDPGDPSGGRSHKVYVFTDRPAYRPEEKVSFKLIDRIRNSTGYEVPQQGLIYVRVIDPRGEKLFEQECPLNEFGTASGEFLMPKDAPLGEYRIELRTNQKSGDYIGQQTLFRLEEYKLPEFRVTVKTPDKDGKPLSFRSGEKIQAEVGVDYYSGGAIPDAEVDYTIYQKQLTPDNPWPQPYPWLYRNLQSSIGWMRYWNNPYSNEQVVKQDKTRTDATGKARIEFQTPPGAYDREFRIEARVTDASRRQVTGSGSIKVTRQAFALHLKPDAQLYQPGDTVEIQVKALDPNGNRLATSATLFITRERYVERKAVSKKTGKERVVFQGYESETIEERVVEIAVVDPVKFSFKPQKEGYYRVKLLAPPLPKQSVTAQQKAPAKTPPDRIIGEAALFVCTKETKDLGYRLGALQLFPQKSTYRVGETARVVVIMPEDGGTALLTLEGQKLLQHRVLRMGGTVQVVEFPITEAGQPNVFVNALAVSKGRVMMDTEELVVPPEEHFLTVEVKPALSILRPGEKSRLDLLVRDAKGNPVKAELALGVADSSIYYIQPELAGDIREFYFGEKNNYPGQPTSMLNEIQVRELLETESEEIIEIEKAQWSPAKGLRDEFGRKGFETDVMMGERASEMMEGTISSSVFGFRGSMSKRKAYGFSEAASTGDARFNAMLSRDQAVPMPASAPMLTSSREIDSKKKQLAKNGSPDTNIIVRSDFRSTAFWNSSILTDSEGRASVEIDYPQSLTEWKATARAVTTGIQFGMGDSLTQTTLPLSTRLQAPRFLVEGDEAEISAILNNTGPSTLNAEASISINGTRAKLQNSNRISLNSGKQRRVSSRYSANKTGELKLETSVKAGKESDAMSFSIPVIEHGIEKLSVRSTVIEASGNKQQARLNLPLPAHREGSATLELWLTPSMASTCLDALPYLAQYPYGCVEQTMSRFLPSAIAARTLDDLGLDAEEVEKRLFGGIEQTSPAKIPGGTSGGKKGDLKKLGDMVKAGMTRLKDMHHGDGGWGWWKQDKTDDFMTAYVVWGLSVASEAGYSEADSQASSGANYLRLMLVKYEAEPDMAAWLLHAIAVQKSIDWNTQCKKAADLLLEQKDKLNPYTRSLLALALHARSGTNPDYQGQALLLVENLENGIKTVKQESSLVGAAASATGPDTCHWGNAGIHYRWSDGGVEATAFALKAMLAIDPTNKRIDQAARWLVLNRRGAQWKNTRDTAIVLLALTDYIKIRKETSPDFQADVMVNGKKIKAQKFTGKDALGLMKIEVPASALRVGDNQVDISLEGKGRLYATANLSYFSKELPIPATGNELYVQREYYRERSIPRLLQGINIERTLLKDGDTLESGDNVEVRLLIEAKNHFEYLLIEDKRPAGCEATEVRSGEPVYARKRLDSGKFEGSQTFVYQELRDQHCAFFITKLEQGVHEIRYKLRAETPGRFHALPTLAHAMYVPEIRGNGDEIRLSIREKAIIP